LHDFAPFNVLRDRGEQRGSSFVATRIPHRGALIAASDLWLKKAHAGDSFTLFPSWFLRRTFFLRFFTQARSGKIIPCRDIQARAATPSARQAIS